MKRAQIVDERAGKAGSNDLAGWQDRGLWPFQHRAKSDYYRATKCKIRYVPERVISKQADRQYLPTGPQPAEPEHGEQ